MRIENIKIENYKSLKNVEIKDLGNLVAFIGPNMAGKSNIFDAIMFLKDGAVEDLKSAVDKRGYYEDVVWQKNPDENIKLELIIDINKTLRDSLFQNLKSFMNKTFQMQIYNSQFLKELHYELHFNLNPTKTFYRETLSTVNIDSTKLELKIIEKELNLRSQRCISKINNIQSQFMPLLKRNEGEFNENLRSSEFPWNEGSIKLAFHNDYNKLSDSLEDKILSNFIRFVDSIQWLNPFHNLQNRIQISGSMTLEYDASNLADIIHTMNSNEIDKFDEFSDNVKSVIPDVERLSTPVADNTTTTGLQETGQPSSIFYNLSNFSAGTKNVLAIIALLITSNEGGLVLIEEPEIHLHPTALRKFMDILRRYSLNKQILITTHAPTVLLNFSIDNIYLVTRDEEKNTQIELATSDNAIKIIKQLGIQPSDFLDYDVIIFVEGQDDVHIYKAFSKKIDFDAAGICLIPTDGWTNMHYYSNARILQRFRVKPSIMAIFDGDIDKRLKAKEQKDKMISKMHVPEANIFSLSKGEIECYLLDVEAWHKTWPDLKAKITKEELEKEFNAIIGSDNQKEDMEKLMKNLGLGDYNRGTAVKILNNMTSIPYEIEEILKYAKTQIEKHR